MVICLKTDRFVSGDRLYKSVRPVGSFVADGKWVERRWAIGIIVQKVGIDGIRVWRKPPRNIETDGIIRLISTGFIT